MPPAARGGEGGGGRAEETAMATGTRSILLALVACLVACALGGCDRGDQPAGGSATTQSAATQPGARGGGGGAGAGARDGCPTEAEIAAVIGTPVKRLRGAGCS